LGKLDRSANALGEVDIGSPFPQCRDYAHRRKGRTARIVRQAVAGDGERLFRNRVEDGWLDKIEICGLTL
jgi:hypothetical protein